MTGPANCGRPDEIEERIPNGIPIVGSPRFSAVSDTRTANIPFQIKFKAADDVPKAPIEAVPSQRSTYGRPRTIICALTRLR